MLEQPPQNKMMTTPPAKKEYHFAATAEHFAEVVYAATIEEANTEYHKIKRLINPAPIEASTSTPTTAAEQSTGAVDQEIKE